MSWDDNIKKIVKYCEEKKWIVVFKGNVESECFPTGDDDGVKKININTKTSKETQFYTLLHEIGHMITEQNKEWHKNKYPGFGYGNSTLIYRTTTIQEELECWDRGYRLAKRMGLKINEDKFLKVKAQSVHTHIRNLFLFSKK